MNLVYRNNELKIRELQNRLNKKKTELALAEQSNKEFKELTVKTEKAKETLAETRRTLMKFKSLYDITNEEDTKYKQRRLDYLSDFIDKNLGIIFPYDDLKAKIDVDFKYKSQLAELILKDSEGFTYVPKKAEGGLKRHLISFSSSLALAQCMGAHKLYMDEAFNTAHPENLTKLGEILNELTKTDFQVILVEHQSDIYKDVPRREIHLSKDPIHKRVVVDEIIDY